MVRRGLIILLFLLASACSAAAQDLDAIRDDQINRLKNYVVDAILPSGLVRDSLVLSGNSFHPATADAAGFALLALSALDHLDKLPDAEQRVETILSAYAGQKAGRRAGAFRRRAFHALSEHYHGWACRRRLGRFLQPDQHGIAGGRGRIRAKPFFG